MRKIMLMISVLFVSKALSTNACSTFENQGEWVFVAYLNEYISRTEPYKFALLYAEDNDSLSVSLMYPDDSLACMRMKSRSSVRMRRNVQVDSLVGLIQKPVSNPDIASCKLCTSNYDPLYVYTRDSGQLRTIKMNLLNLDALSALIVYVKENSRNQLNMAELNAFDALVHKITSSQHKE